MAGSDNYAVRTCSSGVMAHKASGTLTAAHKPLKDTTVTDSGRCTDRTWSNLGEEPTCGCKAQSANMHVRLGDRGPLLNADVSPSTATTFSERGTITTRAKQIRVPYRLICLPCESRKVHDIPLPFVILRQARNLCSDEQILPLVGFSSPILEKVE